MLSRAKSAATRAVLASTTQRAAARTQARARHVPLVNTRVPATTCLASCVPLARTLTPLARHSARSAMVPPSGRTPQASPCARMYACALLRSTRPSHRPVRQTVNVPLSTCARPWSGSALARQPRLIANACRTHRVRVPNGRRRRRRLLLIVSACRTRCAAQHKWRRRPPVRSMTVTAVLTASPASGAVLPVAQHIASARRTHSARQRSGKRSRPLRRQTVCASRIVCVHPQNTRPCRHRRHSAARVRRTRRAQAFNSSTWPPRPRRTVAARRIASAS